VSDLPLFKKKLTEYEAPEVLAEIVKIILSNASIDTASIIKQYLPIPLPTLPQLPGKERLAEILARAVAAGIPRDKALKILKEIKEQLDEYKI
jgi:hypothetical protein